MMEGVTQTPKAMSPPRNKSHKDNICTPQSYADEIVAHFRPEGKLCDPFAGDGAFVTAMRQRFLQTSGWIEGISHFENRPGASHYNGKDFFEQNGHFDYLVTNPPYSQLLDLLPHSFEIADNVIYLIRATAAIEIAKQRAAARAGFGLRELFYVPFPREWDIQSFGAGLAAAHWQRGYESDSVKISGRFE